MSLFNVYIFNGVKYVYNCFLRQFYGGSPRVLSDNSNTSMFSVFSFIDCAVLLQFEIVFVLGVTNGL